jgi:endonuclease-3
MAEKMTPDARFIYMEISRLFPDAHCELNYSNELELFIAVMLSAQTTDKSVNAVTEMLFLKYPTIDAYAKGPLSDLENDLCHLGIYKNKAKHIQSACQILRERFQGVIPSLQSDLESLPGVGRKTADVFLSEWYHLPRIAVDTHVRRVSLRLGLAFPTDSLLVIEEKLMSVFPSDQWIDLHHKLIFFGRYFCTAKHPSCLKCPLISICLKPFL